MLLLALPLACGSPQSPEETPPSLLRGSRDKSPSVKASEDRPHPFDEEHGPFQADRMDVAAHAERERRRHAEGHSKQVLVLERFSHPACSGLEGKQRTGCPLLAGPWARRREIPGGVELSRPGSDGALLQRRVLCHVAFGRVQGHDDGCPLHRPGLRASVLEQGGTVHLRVVTKDPQQTSEVRRRVKALAPPGEK